MDRRVERSLKILGIVIVAIVVFSIGAGYIPPLAIKAKAQAGTITLSSKNLNPFKVIEIRLTGDLGDAPRLQVVDTVTNEIVKVHWRNTTEDKSFFVATRIGPSAYVAYLGGPLVANLSDNPKNPLTNIDASIANLTSAVKGRTYRIEVLGTGIFETFVFDTVASEVTIPFDRVSYRRDAIIPISFKDLDLNKDPTNIDTINRNTSLITSAPLVTNNTPIPGGVDVAVLGNTTTSFTISIRGNITTPLGLVFNNYVIPGSVVINISLANATNNITYALIGDSRVTETAGKFTNQTANVILAGVNRIDYVRGDITIGSVNVTLPSGFGYVIRYNISVSFNYTVSDKWATVDITLIKSPLAGGGQFGPFTVNITDIALPRIVKFNETAVNSGTFRIDTSIKILGHIISNRSGLEFPPISDGDRIVLRFLTGRDLQGDLYGDKDWGDDPATQFSQTVATAIYRPPTIDIDVSSKKIVISINSPDDNVNPGAIDMLDTGFDYNLSPARLRVFLYDKDFNTLASSSVTLDTFTVSETDVNTGRFRLSLSLGWNYTASVNITAGTIRLPVDMDGPFYIHVRYITDISPARKEGYGIDARRTVAYTPTLANLTVVKASLKTWIIDVSDMDLNNRDNVVETLTPSYKEAGKTRFSLMKDGVEVASLAILDKFGNVLSVIGGLPASGVVTFAETDFDSGVFTLVINASALPLNSGETYFIRYVDRTGFSEAKGTITIPVTVTPVRITLDRSVYPVPAGTNKDVIVSITYVNDFYDRDPTKRDTAFLNVSIKAFDGTTIYPMTTISLTETGISTGVFRGSLTVPSTNFSTPKIIEAKLIVEDNVFLLPDGLVPNATAVFRPSPSSISVNATLVRFGDVIEVRVESPDDNVNSASIDTLNVTITTPSTSFNITLTETAENTGVFVERIRVSWDDPKFEGKVFPGDTIRITFMDTSPVTVPTAGAWPPPVPYVATVKVRTFTGNITVTTAVSGAVGPFENFNIFVTDPDLNRYMLRADEPSVNDGYVAFFVEGLPGPAQYLLKETGANTDTFVATRNLTLVDVLKTNGIITDADLANPRALAEKVATFINKMAVVSYVDITDASGNRNVINMFLRIRAFDASISTAPADFVNIGETLTITVTNRDIAGTDIVQYKLVTVRSTTYPVGIQFPMTEISPGVFQVNITIVDLASWTPGAPQIPAKLGDTITIEYTDPITADGRANVMFTKQVVVGRFLERPARVQSVDLLDPTTGTPTTPRVNVPVLISVNLSNVDVIDRYMTAFVIVRDANNVTVALFAGATTVPAGKSVILSFQWIPFTPGTYTIEVIVVKTFTDRAPLAPETFRRTITVTS